MRQVVQNFRSGELKVKDVPDASGRSGGLLVANVRSLISAGTEKSTVGVAKKSLLGKAMEKPDMVRKVLDKALKDGIQDTARMVFQRLDSPVALGYSSAGVVVEAGSRAGGFTVGDRVACAGQNYASHSELVYVPKNLCVRIPDGVDFDDASYVTLGAIALQGVRQADPRLGDVVAVIGLGLLGQLVVQMLKANGCRVIASDIAADKLELARTFGADDAVTPDALGDAAMAATAGNGVDAVIIAASTKSNAPVATAGEISRKKGRVVILGAVGMDLPREPYYVKELELRLSMSYGPGRYDPAYEEKGLDYPYGYVRWTEQRNMEAFLWLIAEGKVDCKTLTTHQFDIDDAEQAYATIMTGQEPYLGILLRYQAPELPWRREAPQAPATRPEGRLCLGLIGAGNHVRDMLLPHLQGADKVELRWVCTGTGINADALGDRLSVPSRTTDYRDVLADANTNAVLIGTRHNTHATMVREALDTGKHVFVEKPLCLTEQELDDLEEMYPRRAAEGQRLMVGFNRRFSEHARRAREFFADRRDPIVMTYRVNAGAIPADSWIQDLDVGGGRIVGEGCHFIDFMQYVCGSVPVSVHARSVATHSSGITEDQSVVVIGFADGSIGTLVYAAGGQAGLAKERFEAMGGGRALVMDDFLVTDFFGPGKPTRFKSGKRDKGFAQEMAAFVAEVTTGQAASMRFDEIVAVSRACILAVQSMKSGETYDV